MYSREQAKKLKEEFWTNFGRYMSLVPSADSKKVNWVNYKTNIKHLFFRMDASSSTSTILIELTHPNVEIRSLMYAQFVALKKVLDEYLQESWQWEEYHQDEHFKETSRIYMLLENASILNKEDWPQIISFLKPRIIALDAFWSTARYSFDMYN